MLFNEKANSIATRQIDIWYETSTYMNKLWSYSNCQKFSRNVDVIIYQIFSIYNSLFDNLNKTKNRLRRKRVSWKKKLMSAIEVANAKLRDYYSKTQKNLEYLYDKTCLLCSLVDDTQFKDKNWEIEIKAQFFRDLYWEKLRANYEKYKLLYSSNSIFSSQNQRLNRKSQSLDELLKKEVNNEVESSNNEFERYKNQDILHFFLSTFLLIFLLIKFDKRFTLTNYLILFRYLRDKNILKQWKIIENEFFIMTRIVKNVLVFISINVSCERLFSIVSRQYAQHKTYFSIIIRALMIIRHHDVKENDFERFHEIWKTKNNEIAKKFK